MIRANELRKALKTIEPSAFRSHATLATVLIDLLDKPFIIREEILLNESLTDISSVLNFLINKENPPYVTVTGGMSGSWFAVLMTFIPMVGFYDVWTTGVGRYPNRFDAENEARSWAKDEGVEYRD